MAMSIVAVLIVELANLSNLPHPKRPMISTWDP
jgi:hypothetical protein